ncbi:hypothetical protein Tco_0092496 [Tanacetum coccineum]
MILQIAMAEMVNQRKKHFVEERAKAKRNKPMTQSQLRIYMSNFLKNQETWKLSQLKKLKFEEIKEEFDKLVQQIKHFCSLNLKLQRPKLKKIWRRSFMKRLQETKKYGTNRSEDAYDRVLWSDLMTMFDPPLNDDCYWSLPLQPNIFCPKSLQDAEMKLLDGRMNKVCYKLLKMIEKQVGIIK